MSTTSKFSVNVIPVLPLFLLFALVPAEKLKEGDPCPFKDGSRGVCKYLTECPAVLAALEETGDYPENSCEFEGTQSIFCCKVEGSEPSSTTTDATPTTTTTASTTTTTTTTTQATTTSTQSTTTTQTTPSSTTTTSKNTPKPEVNLGSRFKRVPGEISKQKCKEYAQYVFDMNESPTLLLRPRLMHSFECAFEKLELIVGGTLASRQEFPHMALIGYETSEGVLWDCGGSLISEKYILSAGHCTESRQAGPAKYARLGITNQTDIHHLQELTISEIISYPEYTSSTKYNDIALFKLSESAELNTFVRPACLYTEKQIPFQRAIASGWGNIAFTGKGSNDLLKVVLEFFTVQKCNSTYSRHIRSKLGYLKRGIVDDIMVCAGSTKDIKNTCQRNYNIFHSLRDDFMNFRNTLIFAKTFKFKPRHIGVGRKGDSGGPLQIYHEDTADIMCMYDIVGVTSFGKSCGLAKNVPGVYTRVSAYIEWIENIVWPE